MPICLPGKANFSKTVALQNCCLAVIAGGIQRGTSQGFPTAADVGQCHQPGLPMAGGAELIYQLSVPLSHSCSWLCQGLQ